MACEPRRMLLLSLALLCLPTAAGQAGDSKPQSPASQQSEPPKDEKAKRSQMPKATAMTPAREAAALTFARLHHPELADLLETLKEKNPPAYNRAVRQLFLASEKLARIRERAPDSYQLQLESWKLESRIQLLAARMAMSGDSKLEAELKSALLERLNIRADQLRAERAKLAARLQKIDEQIHQIEQDSEKTVLRDLQRVKNSLRLYKPKHKKPTKTKTRKPGGSQRNK